MGFSMKVGIYGFGAIGRLIAKVALDRGYEIVGAVDINPELLGKDIGELLNLKEKLGAIVSKDPSVLKNADVVFHSTGSYLDKVFDQIVVVVNMGIDVVSTCETLSYPWYRYPVLARRLDELAKMRNVVVLGTGINPGFLLDTLIITLTAPFNVVKEIRAVRSVDAAKRRLPFRKKIGVGEDPKLVEEKLRRGEITGHVGFSESVLLIADAAGINLDKVEEGQKVVIAESDIESAGVRVLKGQNRGLIGYGSGYVNGKEIIRLEFHAYVAAPEYEEIKIIGKDYTITWRSSGTPGDMGTAAVLLSLAEKLASYTAGLLTMADLIPFKPNIKISS